MNKIYGATAAQNGLYKIGTKKWELFYGFGKDHEEDETGWNYRERFDHRPSLDEIKSNIIGTIESEYAERLKKGFVWNGKPVEYTEERKTDFTGVLVAMQGGLLELPIEMNLGKYEDGSPVFHSFDNPQDIAAVAQGIVAHKTAIANAEWREKESIKWADYENEQ